tara:strand:+ start:939 stop:1430 length:492 start_codon:yes stop_codon:yes gene_type:complete
MKKGLKLFAAFLCIVAILFILPQEFHAEKTQLVNGSKSEVAAYVTDLNKYTEWNPWFNIDPEMEVKVGDSTYEWTSTNDEVGAGIQTKIYESADSVAFKLKFTAPMENKANSYLTFKEVKNGTEVTWGFRSEGNILIGLVLDPSGMVGDKYVEGLKTLATKFK